MTSRIAAIVIDAHRPDVVAQFWCDVLGWRILDAEPDIVSIAPSDASWPTIDVVAVPEQKSGKNRLHLDVRVGTGLVGEERVTALEAECERLVALGATKLWLLRADGFDESCLVMQDVEGNEFCLD